MNKKYQMVSESISLCEDDGYGDVTVYSPEEQHEMEKAQWKGAGKGALAGGLAGGATGAIVSSLAKQGVPAKFARHNLALGVGTGMWIGMNIGAIIGTIRGRWKAREAIIQKRKEQGGAQPDLPPKHLARRE